MKLKLIKNYIEEIERNFKDYIFKIETLTENEVYVYIKKEKLPDICEFIFRRLGGYLSTMVGVDKIQVNNLFEVYYVFSMEDGCTIDNKPWIVVVAGIPSNSANFPAVTSRIPAASWYEREVRDLLGLVPVGHPDTRRLVLPDDWPDDIYIP